MFTVFTVNLKSVPVSMPRLPAGLGGQNLIMQILTDQEIRGDIQNYEQRITAAREKLAMLPEGYLSFANHKKREKERRELQTEIQHVQTLIRYAQGALKECDQEVQLIES